MNISKKLAAVTLATGITITSLGGCSKEKEYILEGTLLDKAVVVTIDGDLTLVTCEQSDKKVSDYTGHVHYINIINGELLTDYERCHYINARKVGIVEKIRDILYYLTEEEMEKAMNDELTNKDLIAIISRIRTEQEETKVKTR